MSLIHLFVALKTATKVMKEVSINNLNIILPFLFILYILSILAILTYVATPLAPFVYSLF